MGSGTIERKNGIRFVYCTSVVKNLSLLRRALSSEIDSEKKKEKSLFYTRLIVSRIRFAPRVRLSADDHWPDVVTADRTVSSSSFDGLCSTHHAESGPYTMTRRGAIDSPGRVRRRVAEFSRVAAVRAIFIYI